VALARPPCPVKAVQHAPGDDVRPRDRAQLGRFVQAGEGAELLDVDFVAAAAFGIGNGGESLEFRGHGGQVAELGGRQRMHSFVGLLWRPYQVASTS
jgi:hypothetical protein